MSTMSSMGRWYPSMAGQCGGRWGREGLWGDPSGLPAPCGGSGGGGGGWYPPPIPGSGGGGSTEGCSWDWSLSGNMTGAPAVRSGTPGGPGGYWWCSGW